MEKNELTVQSELLRDAGVSEVGASVMKEARSPLRLYPERVSVDRRCSLPAPRFYSLTLSEQLCMTHCSE